MEEKTNYDSDELKMAKQTSMLQVVKACGYEVEKQGNLYSIKGSGHKNCGDLSSIKLYNDRSWFRWSNNTGGSQIDFLTTFNDMTIVEAVHTLCAMQGYSSGLNQEQRKEIFLNNTKKSNVIAQESNINQPFVLPDQNTNLKGEKDDRKLFAYLNKTRCINPDCIKWFQKKNVIYESKEVFCKKNEQGIVEKTFERNNIVFKGNDKNGVTKFASRRGTNDTYGSFKMDVQGNDKNYGFNVVNLNNNQLNVFEAAIDLMSYCDYYNDYVTNKIALGGVSDHPLETLLGEYNHIDTINFCLDNDRAGLTAMCELVAKYKGYEIKIKRIDEVDAISTFQEENNVNSINLISFIFNSSDNEMNVDSLRNILSKIDNLADTKDYSVTFELPEEGKDYNENLKNSRLDTLIDYKNFKVVYYKKNCQKDIVVNKANINTGRYK